MEKNSFKFFFLIFLILINNLFSLSKDIILKGIIIGENRAYCLIESNNKYLFLKEGDVLKTLIIKRIYMNKVEIIDMESENSFYIYFKGNKSVQEKERQYSHEPEINQNPEKVFSLERKKIEYYLNNLDKILYSAKATPYFEDGQMKGFKISLIDKGSIIDKMGIVNGDIIYSVNGKEIKGIEDILYFLNSFYTLKEIRLGILRNGKRVIFNYRILK